MHNSAQSIETDHAPTGGLLPVNPLWKTLRRLGRSVQLVQGETLSSEEGVLVEAGALALFADLECGETCVGLVRTGEVYGLTRAVTARPSSLRAIVIADGSALQFSRIAVRREWETSAFFRDAALLEVQYAVDEARRWAACVQRHGSRQRLATLLLRLAKPAPQIAVTISQETAARILDLRRTTVSAAASDLAAAKAIQWRRRRVNILDAAVLEQSACSCAAVGRWTPSEPSTFPDLSRT